MNLQKIILEYWPHLCIIWLLSMIFVRLGHIYHAITGSRAPSADPRRHDDHTV